MKQVFNKVARYLGIIPVLSILLLAGVAKADTGPIFNDLPNDEEFLVGRNVTQNQTTWTDPVSAKGGETVDVSIYYHNGVPNTQALNTTIKAVLPADTEVSTSHTISATIAADNATTVNGTVVNGQEIGKPNLTITSPNPTKVAFKPGSVRWYPNQIDRLTGVPVALPNSQTGDSLVNTGVNIGTLNGCFQYSGHIVFSVTLTDVVVPGQARLKIEKDVRRVGVETDFQKADQANPGDQLEYKVMVSNFDGVTDAQNLLVQDVLPANVTYVGPTVVHFSNGTTTTLTNGDQIVSTNGVVVTPVLKALDSLYITFLVKTDTSIAANDCRINTVTASSPTALNSVQDTAKTCFIVPTPPASTPAPPVVTTPAPPVVATPIAQLPRTGPEMDLLAVAGLTGASSSMVRYYRIKKKLKKALQVDVL